MSPEFSPLPARCRRACCSRYHRCRDASVSRSLNMRLRRVMMTRYLSGLCVAGLGLCAGGWLVVAGLVFGGLGGPLAAPPRLVNLGTGVGLLAVSAVTAAAWAATWRRRLRADGVLGGRVRRVPRREARRTRRQLAGDIRQAARMAKQATREAHRAAGPAAGDFGISGYVPDEPDCGHRDAFRAGGGTPAGHDGASAAELLGELRALLAPLLAAAPPAPPGQVARRWPAAWAVPGDHPARDDARPVA